MTTVQGLFTAGDGVGASGHKFSSGSHAEGRIAAKAAVGFILDHDSSPPSVGETPEELAEEIFRPMATYEQHKSATTDPDVNPHYIKPKMLMFRLNKLMDEYVAGTSSNYTTRDESLLMGLEALTMLKEDSAKLAAKDLHELLRCWENYHRIWAAEAHLRHILFRKETRYPGYYYRSDYPELDDENWKHFVNSRFDAAANEWKLTKKPYIQVVS
jgi:adenylylsulfate reductase subunit A